MIQKLVNRFSYLDSLIRQGATGCPKELAQRLGITERAWYKIRDELVNDLDVPLAYDSHRKTYYYTQEGKLLFGFQRRLDTEDMEKLEGGLCFRYDVKTMANSFVIFSKNFFTEFLVQ